MGKIIAFLVFAAIGSYVYRRLKARNARRVYGPSDPETPTRLRDDGKL